MPEAFSPSRSLKYWRMTLRTVVESSFSREASDLLSYFFLCCKRHLSGFVFESRRMRVQLVEEACHGGELHFGGLEGVHAGAEHGGILESFRVPADVLPCHPRAALVAVEGVQVMQVPHQHLADLHHGGRCELGAGLEIVVDLAEYPGTPLRGAADHDRVGAGVFEDVPGLLGGVDVAVGDHRDRDRLLH